MQCPPGYTMRKSYTRKFTNNVARSGYTVRRKGKMYIARPTASTIYVAAQCVKKPSSGTAKFGKLRKGDLIKYGYQYRLSDQLRHKALEKAIVAYGLLNVYHKLDAITKLTIRTAPDSHKVFNKDREWVLHKIRNQRNRLHKK